MNKTLLITGGAGFIGVNAACYFARAGWHVVLLDNLSRRGSDINLAWLSSNTRVEFVNSDVRDFESVRAAIAAAKPDGVLHLAAQVAVTSSVIDPRHDFDTNALGTFNVLEAVRCECPEAVVIYASTNKVYGKIISYEIIEANQRYVYRDHPAGVNEDCQLDFHSPYGCSKGAADQYTLDYARIYGLRTISFRQSCIYGPNQFGVEDQGWVAWFTIAAVLGRKISIYGDGKQVRDVLYVDDLITAYEAALLNPGSVTGVALNIGGGPENTLSLLELIGMLEAELGHNISHDYQAWRPGDQKAFVCDISKAKRLLGWHPETKVADGVRALLQWVRDNRHLFGRFLT